MNRCGVLARRRRWLVATHVAESATEFEMFRHARGEMFDWLRRNERDLSDCGGVSPVQHLAGTGLLGPNVIATHVNYLSPGDASLLARKRTNVVHCPRSHDYFRHREFPYRKLARAGVNLCLGTDSLATVRKHPQRDLELSLFHEMRAFAMKHSRVRPNHILAMTTVNAARALGLRGQIGELVKNACADLIALPFSGPLREACGAVLEHRGNVAASMIEGQWAIQPK